MKTARPVAAGLFVLFALGVPRGLAAEPPALRFSEVAARQAAVRARLPTADPPSEREVRAVEADLIELLRQAPDDPAAADSLGRLYQEWPQVFSVPAPALLDLVEHARDPAGLARRLRGDGRSGTPMVRIVLAALAARPADPVLWKMAADSSYDDVWKAAFLEESFRRLGGGAPDTAAAVAGEWLAVELRDGLAAEALAHLRGLPPAVRARIASGSLPKAQGGFPGPAWWAPRDLRLELAIAQTLAGDRGQAAALEATLPLVMEPKGGWLVPPEPGSIAPSRDEQWAVRRLLDRWLRPTPEDPFERLATALASGNSWGNNLSWYLLLDRLARREGYPAVAAYADRQILSQAGGRAKIGDLLDGVHGLPPRVRATLRRLDASRESLLRGLRREAPGAGGFQAPKIHFEERALPAPTEIAAEAPGQAEGVDWSVPSKLASSLARKERDGDRAVAVGVSGEYDPLRADSKGGYWIYLSEDRGRTWGAPLYTGLAVDSPYRVRERSAIPVLAGDRLRLEVTTREPDPDRVAPQALYFGAGKLLERAKVIEIPLADLRRDSDGDGLTDLAEQRLLTDPEDPDTDGDGLPDAADPLPGVPFVEGAEAASRAAAIVSTLRAIGAWDPQAYKPGESPAQRETDFLISDPALFTGFRPVRRAIVIDWDDWRDLGLKGNVFLDVFFDHSGRRAFAIWGGYYKGGQMRLEESDGVWKRLVTSSWVA